jgi:hypothetical protein
MPPPLSSAPARPPTPFRLVRVETETRSYFVCENFFQKYESFVVALILSVCGSDPGFGAFLTPGSGMGKKSGSGSGMNNPDHISECLETIFFGLKYLNSFMRIRDGKNSDPGITSRICNIENTYDISFSRNREFRHSSFRRLI